MKNITRHTGIITDIKRLESSKNGNPRFEFTIDGYRVRTTPDSSYGYSIQNYENKEITVTLGLHYEVLSLDSIYKRQSLDTLLNSAEWAIFRKEPDKAKPIYEAMIRELNARIKALKVF